MPPDISGVGATPRLLPSLPISSAVSPGATPLGPASPIAPSTAVVPVAPTGTRGPTATSSPLGRSGLEFLDVIGTTDLLVERATVAPVALHVGLETARGALLRGLAAESLAALDGVWECAQATEEGWYLRSSALTVLGLPGDAERVATEALQRQPLSAALRFMQSLARLASGDLSGARSAIAAAIEQWETHPVLLMQQVIVLVRQGHRREAERRLQQLLRLFPDHPAADVARTSLHAAVGDVAPDPDVRGEWNGPIVATVAERAMARFVARVAMLPASDAVREGRVLIRAFSAGGSMAGACAPEQAHAARGVLSAIVAALKRGGAPARVTDGASPLEVLLSQWLPLMQAERFDDAACVLRRLGAGIPDAQRRLLAACVPMSMASPLREARELPVLAFGAVDDDGLVQGGAATGPLIPVRLGLALLEARASVRVTPNDRSIGALDVDGPGWGAALLCVVIAAGAGTSGSGAVAVAFGIGAAWLGLRGIGRSEARTDRDLDRYRDRDRDTTWAD